MANLNKVMLIGNVGRDPEMRYTANGTAQTSFSLAVNRNYRGPDNEWKEDTEWFNIVAWRDQAERLSQSVTKGKQLYVEGRIQTRTWDDDQGVKHYRTEVIVERYQMLDRREKSGDDDGSSWGDGTRSESQGFRARAASGGETDPDDLPFE